MKAWFRSKRALIADIDRQAALLTARDEEIRSFGKQLAEVNDVAEIRVEAVRRSLRYAQQVSKQEHRLRVAAEERLAAVVAELRGLRDDINAASTSKPPTAAGVGIARYPLSSRIAARPLPADLADAIDEETDMKRRLDGLGD